MDQLASLIGYAVIWLAILSCAYYVARAAPEFWKLAGWRGATGLLLGMSGFAWMFYAFGHKNEVSSGAMLLGLVAFWGPMLFIIAGLSPQKPKPAEGSPVSAAESSVDEETRRMSTVTMDTHFALEHDVYLELRRPEWAEYERTGHVIMSSTAVGRPIAYVERRTCGPILAAIREYNARRSK